MLTDTAIKTAKAKDKAFRLANSEGLFIHVMPTGKKFWRMRYRSSAGKEQMLTFGPYPTISLRDARVSTDDQSNDPQIKELVRYGLTSRTIRTEKISGSVLASRRPVLSELLKALGKGDALTVVKLDRLGRNAVDVLSLIDTLHEKAISVRISILGLILPNHREGCF